MTTVSSIYLTKVPKKIEQGQRGFPGGPGPGPGSAYPSAGIALSDGSAWLTSLLSTGTGTVVRSVAPTLTDAVVLPATTTIGTVTGTEISYLSGVTSAIQTQIGLKAPLASPTFTGTVVLPATTSIGTVSATELSYLDGVTSALQTQLGLKAPLASPTFTGAPRFNDVSMVVALEGANTDNPVLSFSRYGGIPLADRGAAIKYVYIGADVAEAGGLAFYTNQTVAGHGGLTLRMSLLYTGELVNLSTITGTRLISTIAIGTAPLVITSTTKVGNLHVARATLADTVTVAATANTGCSVALFESATGNLAIKTDTGIQYNASTNTLTLLGNVIAYR